MEKVAETYSVSPFIKKSFAYANVFVKKEFILESIWLSRMFF